MQPQYYLQQHLLAFLLAFLQTLPLGGLMMSSTALQASTQVNGHWQQEWAGDTQDTQKMESQLLWEWQREFQQGVLSDTALTVIGRVRVDAAGQLSDHADTDSYSAVSRPWIDSRHSQLELREFYLDADWFNLSWRLGKQQVVWGQADGLKVLDVVTPQSYREFILDDFDDSRIPLWMVNVEWITSADSSLQFIWIPDTTYHDLAAPQSPYQVTSPLRVPSAENLQRPVTQVQRDDLDRPNHWLKDSDIGWRYSLFADGWDLTLNYLYHYRDFYVPYQQLRPEGRGTELTIAPQYRRSHLLGGTASNAFGNLTLRAELGWYSHSYQIAEYRSHNQGIEESPEISSVIGLDWQGFTDTLISLQWFQSHLLDYSPSIIRDRNEQTLSLLLERRLAHDTWTLKLQGLYSLNHHDQLWRPKISHLWRSNVEVWLGADIFDGTSTGLYGQFSEQDRWVVGFEWGF